MDPSNYQQAVFALAVHGVLLGILTGGAILMAYIFASSRTSRHLTALVVNLAGIIYTLCEGLTLVCFLLSQPALGRQFHRLQALSILCFVVLSPVYVAVLLDPSRLLRKINQAVFIVVTAYVVFIAVCTFVQPDLFVSIDRAFSSSLIANMRWAEVRGRIGPIYPSRDIALVVMLLYMLGLSVYTALARKNFRHLLLPASGLLCVLFMGALDLFFLYGRLPGLRFLGYFSSLTGIGIVVFIVLSLISVVRRFQEESRRLENERKIESLGTLAGGIAHDFNNLLTAVTGYVSLVRRHIAADPLNSGYLDEATAAADRARELSQELLTFSRGGGGLREVISLPVLLQDLNYLLPPDGNIACSITAPPELKHISGDRAHILRVLENIILNAVQAMPEGGTLTVTAADAVLGPHTLSGLEAGDYVKITVRDTGPGIRRSDRDRLFDPFFSTRGKGHGLGLTIAHRIVTLHGGHIGVDSRTGGGTTVTVYLPATRERLVEHPEAPVPPRTLSGRILYLEDEDMVARVGQKMLASLGFEVDTCATGEEIIAAFTRSREQNNPYSFVLLDILIAHGMDGMTTVKELRRIDPDVKAAATSGYTDGDLPLKFKKYGFLAFLPKPFQLSDLRALAEQLLGR